MSSALILSALRAATALSSIALASAGLPNWDCANAADESIGTTKSVKSKKRRYIVCLLPVRAVMAAGWILDRRTTQRRTHARGDAARTSRNEDSRLCHCRSEE